MKNLASLSAVLTLCAATSFAETPASEVPAMELGGNFTFDLAGSTDQFKDMDVPFGLTWMDLTARTHLSNELQGVITLHSEGDLHAIQIWEALGAWNRGAVTVLLGQQNFYTGLLSSRLPSSSYVWEDLRLNAPGATVLWNQDALTLGAAVAGLQTQRDTTFEEEPTNDPAAIVHADWVFDDDNLVRVAGQLGDAKGEVDVGVNLKQKGFLLDAEFAQRLWSWDKSDLSVWNAGLGYEFEGGALVAVRYDQRTTDAWKNVDDRVAAGGLVPFWEQMFVAGEVAHGSADGWAIDLQIGLNAELKLPGFTPQRAGM